MVSLTLLALVAVTSAVAYLVGARVLGAPRRDLRAALGPALECVGLAFVFLGANLALGAAAILAVRAASGHFLSVYLVYDGTVVLLSGLQGLVFWIWWRRHR